MIIILFTVFKVQIKFQSKFFDLARTIIKLNKKEEAKPKVKSNEWWSAISRLAVFGVLNIAIFTLLKYMLRAR